MTLPSSGPLSMSAINAEFGRGNNLNAYRGTTYYTVSAGPFTFSSGTIAFSCFYGTKATANNVTACYLIVGGGGPGGNVCIKGAAGGGSGGQVVQSSTTLVRGTTYTVSVGGSYTASSISTIATGSAGNYGGGGPYPGGSNFHGYYGASSPNGYSGGIGFDQSPYQWFGGGGAGAGGNGGNGTLYAGGGTGGAGAYSSITGATYAGGGGGASACCFSPGCCDSYCRGAGSNGGGYGGISPGGNISCAYGTNGAANSGGGGGGSTSNSSYGGSGGNGGSGLVVIRWPSSQPAASATTGSPSYNPCSGGYQVYTFTGSGSITP